MFGISAEHLCVMVIVLLIVGPKKLPELGQTMGRAIKNFKDALNGVKEAQFQKLEDPKPPKGEDSKETLP
jgi:sec-independent protein translocase protein TatA